MDDKAKRVLSMAVIGVVCVAMGTLVVNHTGADEHPDTDPSSVESEIVVLEPTPILPPSSSSESVDSAFVPSSGASASAPLTTISKPASKPAKPAPPASSALKDKKKKPSYPETAAKRTGDTSSKPSDGTTTKKGRNTAGDNDPIFGGKTSPKGHMTTVGNPGDKLTGDKVGTMG